MNYAYKEKLYTRKRNLRALILLPVILWILFSIPFITFAIDPYDVIESGPPLITDEGILFRYKQKGESPRYVMVSGDFNRWENPIFMKENRHGVYVLLYNKEYEKAIVLNEGKYTYMYLVDGVWVKDSLNSKSVYDQYGTELSYFEVFTPIILLKNNPVKVNHNKYIFYYENTSAKNVYIAGDFNNWNPFSLPMRKNKSGIWEAELDIPQGSYSYRFIVDGIHRKDPLGMTRVQDRFGDEVSYLTLPFE